MRQGPHQGAQKSTITGTGLASTSFAQVSSFTGPATVVAVSSARTTTLRRSGRGAQRRGALARHETRDVDVASMVALCLCRGQGGGACMGPGAGGWHDASVRLAAAQVIGLWLWEHRVLACVTIHDRTRVGAGCHMRWCKC